MRFGAAGEGEREGGMSQRLCNALPPRPPPPGKSQAVHPMLNRKKESRRSHRCGDDRMSGSSFEGLTLPELWEQQSAVRNWVFSLQDK